MRMIRKPSRRAQQLRESRVRVSQKVPFPSPVGGWNTREAKDMVPPSDALILENIIPDIASVRTREGYLEWTDSDDVATHTPGQVQTLAVFKSGSVSKLIGADGGTLFDLSSEGAPAKISDVAEYTVDRWDWCNFDGKIIFVNGTDTPQTYNGTGDATDLTITGPTNPIGCNVFKNRTWFWDDDSQKVYYSALNAAGGACTEFPLNRVGQFGGRLMRMFTWTRDGGSGPDDFAVFLMSSGEAVVYQGSYPGESGDWAIVGVYDIGQPINDRAYAKFGSDILISTEFDIVSLNSVLSGVEAMSEMSKVVGAHRIAVKSHKVTDGWEIIIHAEATIGIVNLPAEGGTYEQHVFNTATQAWAKWVDIPAYTWVVWDGDLYFGTASGIVNKYGSLSEYEETDNDVAIQSRVQTAWLPASQEMTQWVAYKEHINSSIDVAINSYFQTEYGRFKTGEYPEPRATDQGDWGDDWGVAWGGAINARDEWRNVGVHGEVVSIMKYMSTMQRVEMFGIQWLVEPSQRL